MVKLVLCNWYGLPIAARSLGEFQEASEATVSVAILAERVTRKFAQRTAARRVGKSYRLHNTSRILCLSFLAIVRPRNTAGHAQSLAVASRSSLGLVAPSPAHAADLLASLSGVMAP